MCACVCVCVCMRLEVCAFACACAVNTYLLVAPTEDRPLDRAVFCSAARDMRMLQARGEGQHWHGGLARVTRKACIHVKMTG